MTDVLVGSSIDAQVEAEAETPLFRRGQLAKLGRKVLYILGVPALLAAGAGAEALLHNQQVATEQRLADREAQAAASLTPEQTERQLNAYFRETPIIRGVVAINQATRNEDKDILHSTQNFHYEEKADGTFAVAGYDFLQTGRGLNPWKVWNSATSEITFCKLSDQNMYVDFNPRSLDPNEFIRDDIAVFRRAESAIPNTCTQPVTLSEIKTAIGPS